MEQDFYIKTPEGIQLSFETAGIGSRFAAILIDTLIQAALIILILLSISAAGITFEVSSDSIFSWYTAMLLLFILAIFAGYFIFFEMVLKGRSPGKAALKLRVIKANGQPINFTSSLLRNTLRLADMFPGLYAVGIIVMFFSRDSRRVGDFAAGTVVVKEYKTKIPLALDDMSQGMNNTAYNAYPLTSDEYSLLKEFIDRRAMLVPARRWSLVCQLSNRFYDKFHIPPEDRTNPEGFLEMLLKANSD